MPKIKIVSERTVAEIEGQNGAKRTAVLTRKTKTYRNKGTDHLGNEVVSYHTHTDDHREVRVIGLPFKAHISGKDSGLDSSKAIELGVVKIKEDLAAALADLEEITED